MKYLLTALLMLASVANAADFTILVGESRASIVQDGNYWESPYAHSIHNTAPSITLRVDQRFGNWSIGAGLNYVHFSSAAQASGSDAAYYAHIPYPLATFYVNQDSKYAFLSVRRWFGNFYLEAGPAIRYSNFSVATTNRYQPSGPNGYTPGPLANIYYDSLHKYAFTHMIGAGYKFTKHWSASFMMMPSAEGIVTGQVYNVSVGYTF